MAYKTIFRDSNIPVVDYQRVKLGNVRFQVRTSQTNKQTIEEVDLDGTTCKSTDRFISSLSSLYGFNRTIFNFFHPNEVVERISQTKARDEIRVAVVEKEDGKKVALGASFIGKPYLHADEVHNMLAMSSIPSNKISFNDGVIESWHDLRFGESNLKVGSDEFIAGFVMHTPIDGYGSPNAYLSMLRQICTNGMVALSQAFRSTISLGSVKGSAIPTMTRFVESYNDEAGYCALKDRLESSTKSWASIREAHDLMKVLNNPNMNSIHNGVKNGNDEFGTDINQRLNSMAGSATKLYSLSTATAISAKRAAKIPMQCSVYDLINFATEVASHRANAQQRRMIDGWIGSLIGNEFDLEGTKQANETFTDMFL